MIVASGQLKDAKVVILGSTTVGKSSIVTMLTRGTFSENCASTVGAAFMSKTFQIGEKEIKLTIWDTGGSERYRSMAPMYFQNAQGAIIVYDITNSSSFNDVSSWLKDLHEKGPENIVVALAGNKLDLASKREVKTDDALKFAAKNNIKIFKETSALDGTNITEIFADVAQMLTSEKANTSGVEGGAIITAKENKKKECC